MQKNFDPISSEKHWYQEWEKKGYFKPSDNDDAYSIMIPPPNVTGSLHMGHAFQQTIMDALIRYQRMRGKSALWQMGTDHAGIATQMVVERKLAAQGEQTRQDLGREEFVKRVHLWKEESGGVICNQIRRLGASVDWTRERFTMDEGMSSAVLEVFVQLYQQDLIYRGKRLVNWDPKFLTAISDLEVESKEKKGSMWRFKYPLADAATTATGANYIVVATTRPETMLGDTAVAVHPEDARYKDLIGKFIELPFMQRRIPIVADNYVDPEFGSGCVKITPAHDFNDYELGKRHQLPLINILSKSGHIVERAERYTLNNGVIAANATLEDCIPKELQGLERFAARKAIIAMFEQADLLEGVQDHLLKVPYGDRSGVVIEPLLTDQWYVAVEELAKPAVEAVENGSVKFVPKSYENMYFSWMRDVQDWCISRQLWWGHRIPAWYDENGKVYVGRTEQEVREKYNLSEQILKQDEDVLDTWFSSALWTFSTLGWPEDNDDLSKFHPSSILVTGFDIIFFWVARMIMMALQFKKEVPFHTVYVTGLIRDEAGQKMSKSKGNVIDPLDMIDGINLETLVEKRTSGLMQPKMAEKIARNTRKAFPDGIAAHGTDALRFTLAALASTGRDINWDMARLEGYRNFCNKLWNASRYVLQNCENQDCGQTHNNYELSSADKWILSQLQQTEKEIVNAIENYRFDQVSSILYEFIWNQYCDWYLELSKPVLWDDNASEAALCGTRRTLVRVLEAILRLAHPIIPFITEEIWQSVAELAAAKHTDSIMMASYPEADDSQTDSDAEAQIAWLKSVIVAIRNIRGEMNISPKKAIPLLLSNGSQTDYSYLEQNKKTLLKLANVESLTLLSKDDKTPKSSTALIGDLNILVPLSGLINLDAEVARLQKEIDRLTIENASISKKLSNEAFVSKAPEAIVNKQIAQLEENAKAVVQLKQQAQELKTF